MTGLKPELLANNLFHKSRPGVKLCLLKLTPGVGEGPWDNYYGEYQYEIVWAVPGKEVKGVMGMRHAVKGHKWRTGFESGLHRQVFVPLPYEEVAAMYESNPEWGEYSP